MYTDGAWLVDLVPLRDPGLVAQTVVAALGKRDATGSWTLTYLAEMLSDRHLLLLLDNCEHVIDACAALADTLLRRAPGVTILATSRQPLGVPGERLFAVTPLPTPDPEAPPPPPEALSRYDAVALLVERAQAAEAGFEITEDNAEAVTRLAQHLEGVPLALELAAARLRVLSPRQLIERLQDHREPLTSTSRTADSRQASLEALIGWSFDLCTPEERRLWTRLTVFPRDFDVDAAEWICADDALPREQVLRALSGLVDKSIVVTSAQGRDKRLRLPQTLRDYGHTRLERPDGERELRWRHRDYYRRLADQSYFEWFGPRQAEWMAWLDMEYVNLRAALEFCLAEPGQGDIGLSMALRLSPHWVVSGSFGEGRRFLSRILRAHPNPSAGRAMALWTAARLALEQGDLDSAEVAAQESHAQAQEYGDPRELSLTLGLLGSVRVARQDPAAAEIFFAEAVQAAQDEPLATSLALIGASSLAAERGDNASAKDMLNRCLAICDAHNESATRAEALWSYAMLAWQEGDLPGAKSRTLEALRRMRTFGNRVFIANCLEVLAWIAAEEFALQRAALLLGSSSALREALGVKLQGSLAKAHLEIQHRVQRELGNREVERATREGRRMPVDEVVSLALGEQAHPAALHPPQEEAMLTPREREVAALVAQGASNRDIAETLVISQRTAEAHVAHILTKLGFTSRSQIAAWSAERRASTDD